PPGPRPDWPAVQHLRGKRPADCRVVLSARPTITPRSGTGARAGPASVFLFRARGRCRLHGPRSQPYTGPPDPTDLSTRPEDSSDATQRTADGRQAPAQGPPPPHAPADQGRQAEVRAAAGRTKCLHSAPADETIAQLSLPIVP